MSVARFRHQVAAAPLAPADKDWFPRWIQRFADSQGNPAGTLTVLEAGVIKFLCSLRDNGTPAWQRLQTVRAVEAYQRLTLATSGPSLQTIRLTLSRLADQEAAAARGRDWPGIRDERHLVGRIDYREPPILQQTRRELRLRHKGAANRTHLHHLDQKIHSPMPNRRPRRDRRDRNQGVPHQSRRAQPDRRDGCRP